MIILGLDLSLVSTGFYITGDGQDVGGVITPHERGVLRLEYLRKHLYETIERFGVTSAFIEGYSFGSQSRAHSIGEWGGLARWTLAQCNVSIYLVSPHSLKLFTVGKCGPGIKKEDMKLGAYKRWKKEFVTNDECDAFALSAMGLAYLDADEYIRRYGKIISEQVRALSKVENYFISECRKRCRNLQNA